MFSDHVILGSTLITLNPRSWLENTGIDTYCGCLIGMAARSEGQTHTSPERISYRYPWLSAFLLIPKVIQCSVYWEQTWPMAGPDGMRIPGYARAWIILSIFAFEVKSERVSFEEAIAWIKSVELREPLIATEGIFAEQAEESCNSAPSVLVAEK